MVVVEAVEDIKCALCHQARNLTLGNSKTFYDRVSGIDLPATFTGDGLIRDCIPLHDRAFKKVAVEKNAICIYQNENRNN